MVYQHTHPVQHGCAQVHGTEVAQRVTGFLGEKHEEFRQRVARPLVFLTQTVTNRCPSTICRAPRPKGLACDRDSRAPTEAFPRAQSRRRRRILERGFCVDASNNSCRPSCQSCCRNTRKSCSFKARTGLHQGCKESRSYSFMGDGHLGPHAHFLVHVCTWIAAPKGRSQWSDCAWHRKLRCVRKLPRCRRRWWSRSSLERRRVPQDFPAYRRHVELGLRRNRSV